MTLYISGPITGAKNYKNNFEAAKRQLNEAGFSIFNPAEHGNEKHTWVQNMKTVLPYLLECDGIAKLPDWEISQWQIEAGLKRIYDGRGQ
jgi:hypothetical protein